jgi:hypothetical protein
MPASTTTDDEDDVDHSTLDYKARWNNLRNIGNSPIARASIALPILGYLIVFHRDLIDYLKIHSSFCDGCTVSWRLHFLYFGSCFFAIGALVYGFYCPPLIKKYAGATEFFENEKYYFTNPNNYEYLLSLIKRDRRLHSYKRSILSSIGERRSSAEPSDLYYLGGIMGEHYVLQNMSYPKMRLVVGFCYVVGGILISIPTAGMFGQVLYQVIW